MLCEYDYSRIQHIHLPIPPTISHFQTRKRSGTIPLLPKNSIHRLPLRSRLNEAQLRLVIKPQRGKQISTRRILPQRRVERALLLGQVRGSAGLALPDFRSQSFDLAFEFGDVRAFPLSAALLVAADARELVGL